MKKINGLCWSIVIVFLVCLVCSPALAEEKIGFYDMDHVIRNSTAGKKSIEELKKIVDKSKAVIQEKEAELQKLKDELEKQRSLMKPDVLKDKEATYQKNTVITRFWSKTRMRSFRVNSRIWRRNSCLKS